MASLDTGSRPVLCSWLGRADLNASAREGFGRGEGEDMGPIARVVDTGAYPVLLLLDDWKAPEGKNYVAALKKRAKALGVSCDVQRTSVNISGPTNLDAVYKAANQQLSDYLKTRDSTASFTFLLSPGTPAMQAVWMFLSPRYSARMVESSDKEGVQEVRLPFSLKVKFPSYEETVAEELAFVPAAMRRGFEQDILYRSEAMKKVMAQAWQAARLEAHVLILGETGTGKGLLAEWIHKQSGRKGENFLAVNIAGLEESLLASELFGHDKGAFTGADKTRIGRIEAAGEGTLFLDEVGDLSQGMQVKLLRVLEEKKFQRVGSNADIEVKCRILAATHRDLVKAVADEQFREDLYYRLAVLILHVPPLRERGPEDIRLLAKNLLQQFISNFAKESDFPTKLDEEALDVLCFHSWPGNVRELSNVVGRAAFQAAVAGKESVGAEQVKACLQAAPSTQPKGTDGILNRPLTPEFNLDEVLREVERHYLERALKQTGGNRTQVARLLYASGHANHVNNRLEKFPELKPLVKSRGKAESPRGGSSE